MSSLLRKEKLVLSGSGVSPKLRETILDLSGAEKPRVLIDSSAKTTQESYDKSKELMSRFFGELGQRNVDWLHRDVNGGNSQEQMLHMIEQSDVYFVLGGSTKAAYKKWTSLGIGTKIIERVQAGEMVGSGASAGAMIWFDKGYSDSQSYEVGEGEHWDYSIVESTEVLPAWVTAHHSDIDDFGRDRAQGFAETLAEHRGEWEVAIGIDVFAGLVCVDGVARAIDLRANTSSDRTHDVYYYLPTDGVQRTIVSPGETIDL